MRKIVVGLLAVVVIVGIVGYVQRASIAGFVFERGLERMLGADLRETLPDGLHVVLCGAGSPLPDPVRSGPCVAVIAGTSVFVVDSGTGGARNLGPLAIPAGAIDALFLTHFHSDHIDGLGELAMLRWVGAAHTEPLPVVAPPGVAAIVDGFNLAYATDAAYRTAHHGEAIAPPSGAGLAARPFALPADGKAVEVWNEGGVRVRAFAVDHAPVAPAVAYRFDYGGRAVVISGDTKQSPAIARESAGADVLVHEALHAGMVAAMHRAAVRAEQPIIAKITSDIPDYHATPLEAAETAALASVPLLLYYHVVPPLRVPGMEAAFLAGVDDVFSGEIVVGRDGTRISLPAASEAIEVDETRL